MQVLDYWKTVTADRSGFLERHRLLEAYPALRSRVPAEVLSRIL